MAHEGTKNKNNKKEIIQHKFARLAIIVIALSEILVRSEKDELVFVFLLMPLLLPVLRLQHIAAKRQADKLIQTMLLSY